MEHALTAEADEATPLARPPPLCAEVFAEAEAALDVPEAIADVTLPPPMTTPEEADVKEILAPELLTVSKCLVDQATWQEHQNGCG
jgi:hypothetical protein